MKGHSAVDRALREQRREFSNWARIFASSTRDRIDIDHREIRGLIDCIDKLSVSELLLVEDIISACEELSIKASNCADRLREALRTKDKRTALPAPEEDAA